MTIRALAVWPAIFLCLPLAAAAGDLTPVAVMEFASKGGVTQKQMDALSDMMSNEIRDMGNYKVIGKADIRAVLQLEEQKALLGCTDVSCMAEVGGALGVRFIVVGNISKFGELFLLNLKMMDAEKVLVAGSVSTKVSGGEAQLVDALPLAIRDLFRKARPIMFPGEAGTTAPVAKDDPEPVPAGPAAPAGPMHAYTKWGHVAFWSGVGLTAVGAICFWQAEEKRRDWEFSGLDGDASKHKTFNGLAYTGFGLGGALLVTGAVLWVLSPGAETTAEVQISDFSAGPTADGQGVVFGYGGRF